MQYDNMPTVVVVTVPFYHNPLTDGPPQLLMLVRRLDSGLLALPGGYQMRGESWQKAGAREVFEETNVQLNPNYINCETVISVGNCNLLFSRYYAPMPVQDAAPVPQPNEVSEIIFAHRCPQPDQVAFPTHYERIKWFFEV